jgi:phage replication initiation protein
MYPTNANLPEEKLVLDGRKVKHLTRKLTALQQAERTLSACVHRASEAKATQSGVVLDYFRFTFKLAMLAASKRVPLDSTPQDLGRWFAMQFAGLLGFQLGQDRPGRDYYEFTTTIESEWGAEVGSVSIGGESQRDTICFTMKGEACSFANDGWEERVHDYFAAFMPTVTRVDLAKDFITGGLSVDEVREQYLAGGFSYRNRRPSHELHGSWLAVDGAMPHSRTFQVGKRESGKMARFYEKGHQLGMDESPWVRAEIELRNADRVIPWEVLTAAGDYFAGAYDVMALIANREQFERIATKKALGEATGERLIRWIKHAVAPALVLLTRVMPDYDWVTGLVLDQAHRPLPKRVRALPAHILQHGIQAALEPYSTYASAPAAAIV